MIERTERLALHPNSMADLDEIHALYSDPRVWTHYPAGRFASREVTSTWLQGRVDCWERDGLGSFAVRDPDTGALLGHGGCEVRGMLDGAGGFWNLGYRFAPEAQGKGFASEVARHAMARAHDVQPELPVVAYLLEHNVASAAVARKVGLTLQHRAPDAGNPDPQAIRLVYADRELTPVQLASTLA